MTQLKCQVLEEGFLAPPLPDVPSAASESSAACYSSLIIGLSLLLDIKLPENWGLLILIPLRHLVKNLSHCRWGNNYLLNSLELKLPGKYLIAAKNKN